MGIKDYISMSLEVLKDFRVIFTVVLMLIVIEFARFIANYRKRPKKPKVKKAKAPKAAPAKKEEAPAEEAKE
ncbi:MAG: hypothetical protein K5681_08150 [Treponema sp.]|nr:hypothetical protein [Treponema sp.]